MKAVLKLTWRTIRSFFVRYMALLLIVGLSVGFFAGLKVTKDAMWKTCEKYLGTHQMFDFQLFSTLGFTEEDVQTFTKLSSVEAAEGSKTVDAIIAHGDTVSPYKLLSLPEQVNLPSLVSGRMPEAGNECLADAETYNKDDIGSVIQIAVENSETTTAQLAGTEYTIVGLADSPVYLNDNCGTTNIGSGTLEGFFYLPENQFTTDVYTEINLTLQDTAPIFSDAYEKLVENHKTEIQYTAKHLADQRYENLLAESGLTAELAAQMGIAEPDTHVLTRSENTGYVNFKNDTSIVSGIANIFPVFFILIAILVCITTMTRMVDEERTQIGVLKATGFSNSAITAKYLMYAGSATLIGWAIGFTLGTWGLPKIFWLAYAALYDFAPLSYLFSARLAVLTLLVALIGILGSAWFSCRKELGQVPATLLRPRAAKSGQRILLERFTPLWKRLTFLQKVITRNMLRYKRRMVMMLIGISCCSGLVVAAFGVRDSMIGVGTLQFEAVQKYDLQASFQSGTADSVASALNDMASVKDYLTCFVSRVDLHADESMNSVNLFSFSGADNLADYWTFQSDGDPLAFPSQGEALISTRVAETLDVEIGDTLLLRDADMQSFSVLVSGIFDNYVDNFVVISAETYEKAIGPWVANCALIATDENPTEVAKELTGLAEVTGVSQLADTEASVNSALSCLNYIIWMVVAFSGALAFIVIFNLTNINLAERSREIATVQVLGFYPKETESYVLRENLILSVASSIIGIPLGTLFHRIVMRMIFVEIVAFDVHIAPTSYLLAVVCTILFAVVVNLFMRRQINKIHMAESLKAVE